LALDPNVVNEWRSSEGTQPTLVTEVLPTQPVFLHYRTDVCSGCDEMEPHIAILEEEYGNEIEFVHINLDHATAEEDASYDVYDFAGSPDSRFGVPMFTTIIVEMNGTEPEIIYNTQYGSSADQGASKRENLNTSLADALARHVITDSPIGPIVPSDKLVFTELYVDLGCVNCNKSEDALVDLEKEGETSFATFVTDAPGLSGQYASYREETLANKLNIDGDIGHPWAVFAGGPGEIIGASSASSAYNEYLTEIKSTSMADLNLTFGGQFTDLSRILGTVVSIGNHGDSDETILVEAFLVEKSSRWLNYQGHPIPNAFIDILVNDTYTVPAGETLDIESSWTNTSAVQFNDLRLGNIGLVVVAWQNGVQVNSFMIVPEGEDELYMIAQEPEKSALPNSTAEFEFTLHNYMYFQVTVNLSVDAPSNWDTEFSQISLSIPAESSTSFDLAVTGNITWNGQTDKFKVHAIDVSDLTIQTYSTVEVDVKDDIAPPQIINPTYAPDHPDADQQIS
ncbi:MAG: thioredoxin family protein, partial [Thermoplasmata archaeon]|nr:thioredoxin family protein [Thermoplasmata archaeon]